VRSVTTHISFTGCKGHAQIPVHTAIPTPATTIVVCALFFACRRIRWPGPFLGAAQLAAQGLAANDTAAGNFVRLTTLAPGHLRPAPHRRPVAPGHLCPTAPRPVPNKHPPARTSVLFLTFQQTHRPGPPPRDRPTMLLPTPHKSRPLTECGAGGS